jgi:hypothetical protein
MAEIAYTSHQLQSALQSLDMAQSQDFNIKNSLKFQILKCFIWKSLGQFNEIIQLLKPTLQFDQVKQVLSSKLKLLQSILMPVAYPYARY